MHQVCGATGRIGVGVGVATGVSVAGGGVAVTITVSRTTTVSCTTTRPSVGGDRVVGVAVAAVCGCWLKPPIAVTPATTDRATSKTAKTTTKYGIHRFGSPPPAKAISAMGHLPFSIFWLL